MDDTTTWRAPRIWRLLLALAPYVVAPLCRLRVSGDVPDALRRGPVVLAANHVSPFDPAVLMAACHRIGLTPRIMATGGVFRTPVVGPIMRRCGHIRVDRNTATAANALTDAAKALAEGSMVLVYPEGRIGLDPSMWPERGKTGVARMAEMSGAPVLPVAQWGTHAVIPYEAPKRLGRAVLTALLRRPVVHVRFGSPVDLSGVSGTPGARAMRATRLIMSGIDETLTPLRAGEMERPTVIDTSRPHDLSRVRQR
ncbi:1-acyl-sn-glycerol-3-phosphate acyltransferase [Actinoplanes sp. OR16]|uniref:lysophospholipid acyltransferase family protein n=1 Tax=Actinoplanes sp. OR16 TaxID=946334 RepID=UPI000F6B5A7B|nr:lysophospholipid acyltransferase family protein [Actinoplanes sp. OR16]BBH69614.1 1-acyl-sn-glycerol-3-phosphate acyltransferase [Actinoplanes sp. OR16]